MATKNTSRKGGNSTNPREHPSGVDRWTSNGLGMTVKPPTSEEKARIEALNRELGARRKQGSGKAPSKKK